MNIGQPNITGNISVANRTNNGVKIRWDPIVYEDCATNATIFAYDVSVMNSSGQVTGSITLTGEISAEISNIVSGLEHFASVAVAVTRVGRLGNNSCFVGNYPELSFSITSKGR